MKRIIILSGIFLPIFIAMAFAQTSITAEADKTSITTDEVLTYKLTIASAEKNIPTPQLPKFTGFKAVSSAQSSSITFTKGEIKTIVVYVFVLAPLETGKFKIEPGTIKIKNETFSTGAFEIEVKEARPETKPGQKIPLPEETHPEETEEPLKITL